MSGLDESTLGAQVSVWVSSMCLNNRNNRYQTLDSQAGIVVTSGLFSC